LCDYLFIWKYNFIAVESSNRYCLSVIRLLFCKKDNSQMRQPKSTKHGRHRWPSRSD